MDAQSYTWICLTVLSLLKGSYSLTYKRQSDEEKLLDYLFQDYNPSARPVLNSSKTVSVNLQFSLLQVQELNVRSQVLTTTGLLILDWTDERLTWDNEISPLDEIVINGRNIWKPEFAVINGAEEIYGDYSEFQGVVHPSGSVRWEPGGVFKTMCQIDITYYPFDQQKCDLTFGAWSYYTTKMNLSTKSLDINLDTYEKNGEWEIIDTSVERNEFSFECCPHQKFSNIAFSIYIRRRHTFYIMNVILPGILTSAVLLSIFFCTPSQKVHIGVAALLSFRLFLLNVADTIPRTSDHVPLLGIYLTCTMAITTMAMVATVFVLNLYGMKEKPVPNWAKKFFVVYMARILCMCNCVSVPKAATPRQTDAESTVLTYRNTNVRPKYTLVTAHGRKRARLDLNNSGTKNEMRDPLMPNDSYGSTGDPEHDQSPAHVSTSRDIPRANRRQSRRRSSQNAKPDYAKDWVHVAAVCDRLFFWLCFLFICVTTLLLFHPLTTSKYFKIPVIESAEEETEN